MHSCSGVMQLLCHWLCGCAQDPVYVARAPGRLDVMGGIADYSGSLVLQLPLAQACHVAVQRHPLPRQRVWRHMQVRHVRLPNLC